MVLAPEHAREWLDQSLERKRAEELVQMCCQPTEDFEWYQVGGSVGNVENQGPELINPIVCS